MDEFVSTLWMEFQVDRDSYPVCGLCGGRGWIDTRGFVFDDKGKECGLRNPCICPHGRALLNKSTEAGDNHGK